MHAECYRFVERMAKLIGPRHCVLEIGSRNVNGTVRPLFECTNYLGLDIAPGPGVDVVADAATWRPEEAEGSWYLQLFDLVVCTEVLEHTKDAAAICRTAHACLIPGGYLVLTAAGMGRAAHGADGGPKRIDEWYANVSPEQLRGWLRPFGTVLIEDDERVCDVRALAIK